MQTHNMLMRTLAVLSLSGLALLTTWAIGSSAQPKTQATQPVGTKLNTLREIAKERDVEVEVPEMESTTEYEDLGLLAKQAEAIVVARLIDEESAFDGDDHILTSCRLDVQRVLKQTQLNAPLGIEAELPAPLVGPLKVVRPGGVVVVNGRRATSRLKGSEKLKPGRQFLFFLWWSPAYKAYTLAGGVSGVFLIEADQRVKPLGLKEGMRKYEGNNVQAVIDGVLTPQ
jgi:hypothetical protein